DPARPDATLSLKLPPPGMEVDPDPSLALQKSYLLGGTVARGGMGKIYSASDTVLKREVALKVCSSGDRSADALFLREAQVLGELAHPNIVPVHDFGTDPEGRPFYSMKMVRGETLHALLKRIEQGRADFTPAGMLLMFRKICEAVAFAHSRGFLHRDLKPENVMLGEYGEVLVMDWGLAVQMNAQGSALGEVTSEGQIIEGTPQYMAPEQAAGDVLDARSDVYCLGGILYSILTFQLPISGDSLEEILDKVRRGTLAERLSRKFPALPLRSPFGSACPQGLRAILLKSVAHSKEDRYPDVNALISDLDAYLGGFATAAEQANLLRQLLLLVRRHRIAAGFAALLFLVAAGFTVRLVGSQRESARYAAEARANEARALENERTATQSAAEAQLALAEVAENAGRGSEMQRSLAAVPEPFRQQPWHYMAAKLNTEHRAFWTEAAWLACAGDPQNPGGLLALDSSGRVQALDVPSGKSRDLFTIPPNFLHESLHVSPDGSRLLVFRHLQTEENHDLVVHRIELFHRQSGKLLGAYDTPAHPVGTRLPVTFFNPSGSLILIGFISGVGVSMLDGWTGQLLWDAPAEEHAVALFDEKSGHAIVHSTRGRSLRDAWTGALIQSDTSLRAPVRSFTGTKVRFDAEHRHVFFVARGTVRRLDLQSMQVTKEFRISSGIYSPVDFEYIADGRFLVVLERDSANSAQLQFWNADTGELLRRIPALIAQGSVRNWRLSLTLAPRQVAVMHGHELKIWTLPNAVPEWSSSVDPDATFDNFAFLKTADTAAAVVRRKPASGGWDVALGIVQTNATKSPTQLTRTFPPDGNKLNKYGVLSTNHDGSLLCATGYDASRSEFAVNVFSAADNWTGTKSLILKNWLRGNAHLNPAGTHVWLGNAVWDMAAGTLLKIERKNLFVPPEKARAPRWKDNRHVLEITMAGVEGSKPSSLNQERRVVLWDAITGTKLASIHASNALSLAPAPDGTEFAEGGMDKRVRIRDGNSLNPAREFRVHDGAVTAVAWHPRLPILATASDDHSVRLWNVHTGQQLEEFAVLEWIPDRLFWDSAGERLAVMCRELSATISIFRPASVQPAAQVPPQK
ncbi:MAG: hypothetical protein RLZZ253_2531, partial [Verrucomicrobiota bacterium]